MSGLLRISLDYRTCDVTYACRGRVSCNSRRDWLPGADVTAESSQWPSIDSAHALYARRTTRRTTRETAGDAVIRSTLEGDATGGRLTFAEVEPWKIRARTRKTLIARQQHALARAGSRNWFSRYGARHTVKTASVTAKLMSHCSPPYIVQCPFRVNTYGLPVGALFQCFNQGVLGLLVIRSIV